MPELEIHVEPSLDALATEIDRAHEHACDAMQRGLEHARRAGELLIQAKSRLAHGEWIPWLTAHCAVSVRSAQGYMRLAQQWMTLEAMPNTQRVAHFPAMPLRQALSLLAEPHDESTQDGPKDDAPAVSWKRVELDDLLLGNAGWKYDDSVVIDKFSTSLKRHGQLRPVVVRRTLEGSLEVVDGRKLVQAMRLLGWQACMVADIGAVEASAAQRVSLDLEFQFEINYAQLASAVSDMLDAGASADSLSAASPWDTQRILHFQTLTKWDWSQFSATADATPQSEASPSPCTEEEPRETDYRCPSCAYEWSGKPRPFRPGGRAMADARDRRNGVRRVRMICTVEEHKAFLAQVRALARVFGSEGIDTTVFEAVKRAFTQFAGDSEDERVPNASVHSGCANNRTADVLEHADGPNPSTR